MKILSLKYKLHKLVNLVFYLIVFGLGFLLGFLGNKINFDDLLGNFLFIDKVYAEELETKNTHIVCRDSKNLFDPDTAVVLINSYYSSTNGNIYTEKGYNGLKIPVQPNKKYVISTDATNFSNIVFWDDNFNFKQGFSGNLIHNINVPDGVYYITLAIKNDYTYFQIELGEIASAYEPYGKQVCEEIISSDNSFYNFSKKIIGNLGEENKFIYDFITLGLVIVCFTFFVLLVGYIIKKFFGG